MITVFKQSPAGEVKIKYQGEVIEQTAQRTIIQAYWKHAARDLGYTIFETGDQFIEYYYTDRWFNIFKILSAKGTLKGWYCNVAEPALILADRIEQIDLFLDVWVNPQGEPLILDEDEFEADVTLTKEQRQGAKQGLQAILAMVASREEAFSSIMNTEKSVC